MDDIPRQKERRRQPPRQHRLRATMARQDDREVCRRSAARSGGTAETEDGSAAPAVISQMGSNGHYQGVLIHPAVTYRPVPCNTKG